jgi:hypothetical protein
MFEKFHFCEECKGKIRQTRTVAIFQYYFLLCILLRTGGSIQDECLFHSKTQHATVQYNPQLFEHVRVYLLQFLTQEYTSSNNLLSLTMSNTRLKQKSVINNLVTMEVNYSLVTLSRT